MTSTTSAFIPATRAGTPAYSPDSATPPAPGDASETRSFEEFCTERDLASGSESAPAEVDETVTARPTDEAVASESPTADVAEIEENDDDDERSDEHDAPVALPVLGSPSIIQTLLASLRDTAPAAILAPAENAGTNLTLSPTATSVRADGRQASATAGQTATPDATTHRRRGQAAATADGQSESTSARRQPSAAASARATDKEAPVAASPVAVAAKTKATATDEATAQPVIVRLVQARGQAEKSAAPGAVVQAAQNVAAQNKFLNADDQMVTTSQRSTGTRSAIPAGTMNSSTTTAPRHADSPVSATASSTPAGQGAWTETLSVDWKGWTNGGGERSSTAAQFSQLGDKLNPIGVAATQATAGVGRAATPAPQAAAPVAPTVPADAAEALAPIHSAIERLVLHGRDQLALTVRFEQGGSLSIRLAMNQGEIATQIQTDVPGLEAALKSAWGDLAQDWNSKGWKLAQPEFAASAPAYHQNGDTATADDRGAGRQTRQEADEAPDFGARAFSPARLKHAGAVALSGLDALRAAALARRGIHTWA